MCKFNSLVVEGERFQKGDVVFCNLSSTLFSIEGDEICNPSTLIKTRPVLIVKPLKFTCIVLPIKTKHSTVFDDEFYHEIEYEVDHPSLICLSNIMTVDKRQLKEQRVCKFKDEIVDEILRELGLILGIPTEGGVIEKKVSSDPAKDALFDYMVETYGNISAFQRSEMNKKAIVVEDLEESVREEKASDSNDPDEDRYKRKYRKTKKFVDLTSDEIDEIRSFTSCHTIKETTDKFNISMGTVGQIKKGVDPQISVRFNDEFINYAKTYIVASAENDSIENSKIIETYKNYCKNKGIKIPSDYDGERLTKYMIQALRTRSPRYSLRGSLSYGVKFKFN